jgi:hypothetical protein
MSRLVAVQCDIVTFQRWATTSDVFQMDMMDTHFQVFLKQRSGDKQLVWLSRGMHVLKMKRSQAPDASFNRGCVVLDTMKKHAYSLS